MKNRAQFPNIKYTSAVRSKPNNTLRYFVY